MNRIIVALDGMNKEQIFSYLDEIKGEINFVKIGMEAYYKYGRELLIEIKNRYDVSLFLDLKLHDIPNTVKGAISSLEGLPIEFLTVHLQGGKNMLKEAMKQKSISLPQTKLLGVSYLTSLDEHDFLEIWNTKKENIEDSFLRLFKLAEDCKLEGIVCSADEATLVKERFNLQVISPGIRLRDDLKANKVGDQRRVFCAKDALSRGCDYLVIGRSLTTKERPYKESINLLKKEL